MTIRAWGLPYNHRTPSLTTTLKTWKSIIECSHHNQSWNLIVIGLSIKIIKRFKRSPAVREKLWMGFKTNKVNLDLNTELTTWFCPALPIFYQCLSHWKIHHLLNKTHCNVVLQINDTLLLISEMETFRVMKNILIAGNMPRISKWGRKLTKRVLVMNYTIYTC